MNSTAIEQQSALRLFRSRTVPALTNALTIGPGRESPAPVPEQALARFRSSPPSHSRPLPTLPRGRMVGAERNRGRISRLFGDDLTSGTRIEIELPPGTPKMVSGKTFKKLLGGRFHDTLLKQVGESWSICTDSESTT